MNTNANTNVDIQEERVEMTSFSIDQVVFNGFKTSIATYTANIVRVLADAYAFDYDDAMSRLSLDMGLRKNSSPVKRKTTSNTKKNEKNPTVPAILLPWCGVIMQEWCQSVRNNHGLYTQCTNLKQTEEHELCVTCSKEMAKTSNGMLKYGLVKDRPEVFNKQVSYAKIMKKNNITKENAIEEATKFGWTIPESEFDENAKASPRGRPKKVKDTSADEAPASPAKRGRPAKTKPVESASAKDDMLGQMIEQITQKTAEVALEDSPKKTKKSKKADSQDDGVEEQKSQEESPKKKRVISDETKAKMAAKRAEKAAEKAAIKAAEAKAEQERIRMEEEAKKALEQDDEESEEELDLTAFAYKGTRYARDDKTNKVYTIPTEDEDEPKHIGTWDKNTKTITFLPTDEELEIEEQEEHDE